MKNKTNSPSSELVIHIDGILQTRAMHEVAIDKAVSFTEAVAKALSNARLNIADELNLALYDAIHGSDLRQQLHDKKYNRDLEATKKRFGI